MGAKGLQRPHEYYEKQQRDCTPTRSPDKKPSLTWTPLKHYEQDVHSQVDEVEAVSEYHSVLTDKAESEYCDSTSGQASENPQVNVVALLTDKAESEYCGSTSGQASKNLHTNVVKIAQPRPAFGVSGEAALVKQVARLLEGGSKEVSFLSQKFAPSFNNIIRENPRTPYSSKQRNDGSFKKWIALCGFDVSPLFGTPVKNRALVALPGQLDLVDHTLDRTTRPHTSTRQVAAHKQKAPEAGSSKYVASNPWVNSAAAKKSTGSAWVPKVQASLVKLSGSTAAAYPEKSWQKATSSANGSQAQGKENSFKEYHYCPVEGIRFGNVDQYFVDAALKEIVWHFDEKKPDGKRVNQSSSDMLDVQWAFQDAECGAPWRCDPPIEKLPATMALLEAAMSALPMKGDSSCWEPPLAEGESCIRMSRLNVIARRYSPGNRLRFHKDSIGMFEEPVYGVVLQVPSDEVRKRGCCLQFRSGRESYTVPERPGLVTLLTGPARFDWAHGVPGCKIEDRGTRITVTWRWFRMSHARWTASPLADGPGGCTPLSKALRRSWYNNFLAAADAFGVRHPLVRAFLLEYEERRGESVPWLFRSKNEACGPQLSASALESILVARGRESEYFVNANWDKLRPHARAACEVDSALKVDSSWLHGGIVDPRVLPLLKLWEVCQPH